MREQRDPKLRDEADSATTTNQNCSLWISSSSVEAIGINPIPAVVFLHN